MGSTYGILYRTILEVHWHLSVLKRKKRKLDLVILADSCTVVTALYVLLNVFNVFLSYTSYAFCS